VSSLTNLMGLLFEIRRQILLHPVFVRGTGVPVDDPGYATEMETLDRLSQRLDLVMRELKNKQHGLDARERNLWNIPRDQRYGPASSVAQQQEDVAKLIRTACELRKLIEELMQRSGLISQSDMVSSACDLINQYYEQAHEYHESVPSIPFFIPKSPEQFQASPQAALIAVFVAMRALQFLYKKKKGSSSSRAGSG
jgi:hypothetical protein